MKDLFLSLWNKYVNRETVTYLIVGVITTAINYATGLICFYPLGMSTLTSNTIAWLVAVIFAFWANKFWVFQSRSMDKKILWHEFYTFIIARLLSLAFDNLFMWVTVDLLGGHFGIFKILSNVFVMIMNYFASKMISFKKEDGPKTAD